MKSWYFVNIQKYFTYLANTALQLRLCMSTCELEPVFSSSYDLNSYIICMYIFFFFFFYREVWLLHQSTLRHGRCLTLNDKSGIASENAYSWRPHYAKNATWECEASDKRKLLHFRGARGETHTLGRASGDKSSEMELIRVSDFTLQAQTHTDTHTHTHPHP